MTICGCGIDAVDEIVFEGQGISIDGSLPGGGITVSADDSLAWTSFTPTVGNFTLGNAVTACKYLINGSTMDILYAINFQNTSTWTANEFQFSMPPAVPAIPAFALPQYGPNSIYLNHQMIGDWSIYDQSLNQYWEGRVFLGAAPLNLPFRLRTGDDNGGAAATASVRQGTPITFTTGDEIVFRVRIELA